MTLPYGYADGFDSEWCIVDTSRPGYMLCGRRVGFVPVVPPLFPKFVHERCRAKWFREDRKPVVAVDVYGTCPECFGEVPLVGGLVGAHGAWLVGRHGARVSDEPCSGEGERPEVEA